jgi:hypothetical protein
VAAVRIDQPDGGGGRVDIAPTADISDTAGASPTHASRDGPTPAGADSDRQALVARAIEHRAIVDATYRASAIDQAYEKVRDIERGIVTPAMKRIEAEDPERHLAGIENSLKGKDRLAEKAANHLKSNPELSYDQAVSKVKDAIRYTFVYSDDHYTEGVRADTERLATRFELIDLRGRGEPDRGAYPPHGDRRRVAVTHGVAWPGSHRVPVRGLGIRSAAWRCPFMPAGLGLGDLPGGRLLYPVAFPAARAGIAATGPTAFVVRLGVLEI